jgi:hypothetical protein
MFELNAEERKQIFWKKQTWHTDYCTSEIWPSDECNKHDNDIIKFQLLHQKYKVRKFSDNVLIEHK